jgi:hypothetical protein
VTAGTAGSLTVTARDAFGNPTTAYTGKVHLSTSDAQGSLPADYTFTAGDGGAHTFSVTLDTAGSQSITAADAGAGSITGSQTGITVNPAAASTLVLSGFPSSATAGTVAIATVTARDPYGNVAGAYTGTVHIGSSDAQADLAPDYAFTSADAGQHTFTVTLKTAGKESVTATGGTAGTPLVAIPGGPAAGKMDLLTVVLHEMGHLAGRADVGASGYADELMAETLAPGTRRVDALDAVFSHGT